MHRTAFVIGAGGKVGATAAFAMALKKVVGEIVLIDVAEDLVRGQAMDISHATAFTRGVHVRTGDYSEIRSGDIVVITCGAPQLPGQTRLDLIAKNVPIIRDVVRKVMHGGHEVFMMVVSNPVDVLTYVALKESGLAKENVFGTGTTLDSARLQVLLSKELHVTQQDVEAYVLGEHGDSSFVARSAARIGGIPLTDFPGYSEKLMDGVDDEIRSAAYQIINTKGNSHFGIGDVVAELVRALQQKKSSILPVCSLAQGEYGLKDVVVGLPSLISSNGVRILDGYPLTDHELKQLHGSAKIVKTAIESVENKKTFDLVSSRM